jgi:hypothetical protein
LVQANVHEKNAGGWGIFFLKLVFNVCF